MIQIGRGSGKWNMEMERLHQNKFVVLKARTISELNKKVESFKPGCKITSITYHVEDYCFALIEYK